MFIICATNYKRVKVYPNGSTDNGQHYRISALRRNGETIKKHFSGFVDKNSQLDVHLVKLIDIVGIYNDIELIDVPKGHWVLGLYHRDTFSVILDCSKPLYHPINKEKYFKQYSDNVVKLRAHR